MRCNPREASVQLALPIILLFLVKLAVPLLVGAAVRGKRSNRGLCAEHRFWHGGNDAEFVGWVRVITHLEPILREVVSDAAWRSIVNRVAFRQ